MKKKIIGIFVCTLLIVATIVPVAGTMNDNKTIGKTSAGYSYSERKIIDIGYIRGNWLEQAKLIASDGAANDWFGESVSINGDYAFAGASLDDDSGSASGSAYIFKRAGTMWTEDAKLLALDGDLGDYFGWSVSIQGDYAIVGAYGLLQPATSSQHSC